MEFPQESQFQQSLPFSTLIFPLLSIGNVGQLSIDLLISSLNLPRVGFLESPFLLPMVGNDAFSVNLGKLSTNAEVYQDSQRKMTVLQQRSPIIRNKVTKYVKDLVQWIVKSNFKEIIVLGSIDSSRRIDSQMEGTQIRYIDRRNEQTNQWRELGWIPLEEESCQVVLRKGTFLHNLIEEMDSHKVKWVVLDIFCSEGNNIPNCLQLVTHLNQYLQLQPKEGQWIPPNSWSHLYQSSQLLDKFVIFN